MERDNLPHKSAESAAGDGEKKERTRRKRHRAPSHLPLPVMGETAARAQEQAHRAKESLEPRESRRKKKKKGPDATPEITTSKATERPSNREVTEHKTPEAKVAKDTESDVETRDKAEEVTAVAYEPPERQSPKKSEAELPHGGHETVRRPLEDELAVIPLDAEELEEELFVSDRYRRQNQLPAVEVSDAEKPSKNIQEAEVATPIAETSSEDIDEDDDQSPAAVRTATTTRPAATARPSAGNIAAAVPPLAAAGGAGVVNRLSGSGGGANLPPIPPPYNPNIYPGGGNILPPAPVAAAANVAPNRLPNPNPNALNQFQERRNNGQAILAGILVGGLIEHFRHKRREKRIVKAHTKEVKGLNKDHQATREQLHQAEIKGEETKRKQTALERQLERLRKTPTELVPLAAARVTAETTPAVAASVKKTPEQARPELRPNTPPTPEEAIKKAQAAVEQARRTSEEEQPELPPDRRVETSAWHRIEVDKKTGKAVETPTLTYGEEFVREKHQEQLRREIEAASMDSKTVRERYIPAHATPSHDNSQPNAQNASAYKPTQSTADKVKDQALKIAQQTNPVDVALWVVLLIVIWLIIVAL